MSSRLIQKKARLTHLKQVQKPNLSKLLWHKPHREAGFTLIELLIVMGIMAILMALAIPTYRQYIRKAHYAEIVQAADPLKLAVAICFQETGSLSHCQSTAHQIPRLTRQGLVHHGEVKGSGVIHIVPNQAFGIETSDDLILTPKVEGNSLIWHLSGGGVHHGYLHTG
jgi:type IV pilus assembly protein PilA